MSVRVSTTEDAAITFCRNAVRTQYADIPSDALDVTKMHVLDSLAAIVAGIAAPGVDQLMEPLEGMGREEESTVLVYGDKVPAPSAALMNATMCDALEYDDTNDIAGVHTATTVIPGCLAVAERRGGVTGKELLAAVALGVDLCTRMGYSYRPGTDLPHDGWEHTPLWGFFSTALATGKILGLDEEKMVHALGIAYAQDSGNFQCIFDGALTKRLQIGFASRGGVTSALMAERGITGARNVFEGRAGLYNVYHRVAKYDRGVLMSKLGERFEGVGACIKPYPCCRGNHGAIDAALALRQQHHLEPEEVAHVTVTVGNITNHANCVPLDVKRSPSNPVVAQFSLPCTVATALVYGRVGLEHFTVNAIENRRVLEMAHKVTPKLDNSLSTGIVEPIIMEIQSRDGRVFSKRVDFYRGNPKNPVSWDDIKAKVWDCATYSASPLPSERFEKLIEIVPKLQEVEDMTSVVRLLS